MLAQQELAERRAACPIDHDGVYDLVLLATGNRERAEDAARAVIAARLRADAPE